MNHKYFMTYHYGPMSLTTVSYELEYLQNECFWILIY